MCDPQNESGFIVLRSFQNAQFLVKVKVDEDFNRKNTKSILRIEIRV